MQIDWFTIVAQMINFIILVWLLKRFLYQPILDAVDKREKKIASQLEGAEKKEKEAIKEKEEFKSKNETFESQKKELMNQAVADTEKERQKLLEEARNEVGKLRTQLENSLKEISENHNREIQKKLQTELIEISEKVLSDLANLSLEDQTINAFVQRLNALKEGEKKELKEAFKHKTDPILIRSGFEIASSKQTEIKQALMNLLGDKIEFRFEKHPRLISGIELTTNGYKLSWSISGYLDSLKKSISDGINKKKEMETE